MDKANIIRSVGPCRYEAASRELQQIARRSDFGSNHAPTGPDLSHEVSDLIWDSGLTPREKLALFFELYKDLPSYGMLMYTTHVYKKWTRRERSVWWEQCRSWLRDTDDGLRNPLLYALWCDYFEDQQTVADAWAALIQRRDERILRAVLPVSGPVPWELKYPVLNELAGAPEYNEAIYRALWGAAFDVYGKIEGRAAQQILGRLRIPESAEGYARLKQKLTD